MIAQALTWIIPVLIAITFHEAAHGYVAWRLGDPTAYQLGRVTFNPIKHIDPLGTVLLPALLFFSGSPFLFGYAKPVPVTFSRLRNPKKDMVWVALAGPLVNVILAGVGLVVMSVVLAMEHSDIQNFLLSTTEKFFILNLILAVFNMLPIPPLDGGRVLVGLLPDPLSKRLESVERYGLVIVIGLVFLIPLLTKYLGMPLNPFHWLVVRPTLWLANGFLAIFKGLGFDLGL